VIRQKLDQILLVRLTQSEAIEQPLRSQLRKSIDVSQRDQMQLEIGAFHRPPWAEACLVVPKGLIRHPAR
jgi:hypothetical protein